MENYLNEKKFTRTCDGCRESNLVCSGTLPCENCFSKQSSSSMTIECTYNQEVKNRQHGSNRTSNKQIYSTINEKMDKLQSIISSVDYQTVNSILNEAILMNSHNLNNSSKMNNNKKRKLNDFIQTPNGIEQQVIKNKRDSTKILKMGIKTNSTTTFSDTNSINSENSSSIDNFEVSNTFLGEEGQLEQSKLSFKLFYYLNPSHLKKLISNIKSNSIQNHKSSIYASEVLFTLNKLLQKDNDIYVKNLFQSDFDLQFNSQEIMKIPTKIMEFIKPKVLESNDFFFIKSQKRVMKLYNLFETLNASTDESECIKLKGKMSISEMNLIFTILLNNITLYKNEKEEDVLFFEELVLIETVLLKYIIDFYKIFAAISRNSDTIENNVYNIQSLLQFAFYLENSPSPTVSARIISSCISYIQLLHYNDSDYINQLLPNEEEEYPESLKFQIRSLYLTCYMYDKTISLRCHKPEFLNNKDEAFTVMNHHTRDLLKYYNLRDLVNDEESTADENEYINILEGNTELYNKLIHDINGSNMIIQHLNLRVSYLHSLAYKYLIATNNENDPIEITLQKKYLVLENLHTFKLQVKTLFGFKESDQSINIVSHISKLFSSCDTITKVKLAWKYIITAMHYYTLVMIIHLSDLEILQNVETPEDIAKATKYCENPKLLKAIEDCLKTSIYTMEFNGFHKYESGSVLFCALIGISSAFNVCIFNQKFFEEHKELMVKVIKLVTKTSLKRGFIDTLKWSAISVLGMSTMKILFELNSDSGEQRNDQFKELFKDDYVQTVDILKQVSKNILHALDTKRFKEYVQQNKVFNRLRDVKEVYHPDIDENKMVDLINLPYDEERKEKDVLEQFNLQVNKEDMDNLNAEIESFMDKEIMKLLNLEGNVLGEANDDNVSNGMIQTVFSNTSYSLGGFLDDELFEQGLLFKE